MAQPRKSLSASDSPCFYSRSAHSSILANFGEISIQTSTIEMIMANFLSARHQYRDSLAVTCTEIGIAIHIHHFETEGKPRLQFPQGGYHVMTKMAMLPAVNDQRERIGRPAGNGCGSGSRHPTYCRRH